MAKLYAEPFVVACSAGHRFASQTEVRLAELDGELYFSRINCEYDDVLDELCTKARASLMKSYRSEREDRILTMVAAGMGVCFLPEYTAIFPGVVGRPVVSPSVERAVCLVTVVDHRQAPSVTTLVQAVRTCPWPSPLIAGDQDRRQRDPYSA